MAPEQAVLFRGSLYDRDTLDGLNITGRKSILSVHRSYIVF